MSRIRPTVTKVRELEAQLRGARADYHRAVETGATVWREERNRVADLERLLDHATESLAIEQRAAAVHAARARVAEEHAEALWASLQRACSDRVLRGYHARALQGLLDYERERAERLEALLREARVLLREREPALRWDVAARATLREVGAAGLSSSADAGGAVSGGCRRGAGGDA